MGNPTLYKYDAANELIATTDANGNATIYQYDELGREIARTDALAHTTRTEYDKLGNVTATIDANNHRTEYSYDALNRRVSVKDANNGITKFTYDKVGDVLSVTDALNHTTSYAYDLLNRQISVTDALNQTSTTAYNAVGRIVSTTDALNRTTSYGYDNLNRRISTTDALNQTRSVTYDKVGNLTSRTDELGRTTIYGYDKVNRRISITDPLLHTSTTSYDTEGNVTSISDALNHTTSYLYDKDNRQVQVIDAKNGVTQTSYDRVGNIAAITDADNNTTTYAYDAVDRLITNTNQLGKARTYSYDVVGNRVETIDRDGRKIDDSYDSLNRQTAEHWLDNSGTDIRTFNYNYDAVGHLLGTNDPDSKYTYTYDLVDRITSVDNLGTIGVPNVLLNYSYDAVGNLLSVSDKINGVLKGTNAYTYDTLNRVTRLTQSGSGVVGKRVDMAYNAASQMTGLYRYGDLAGTLSVANTSYAYDLAGRLTNLKHQRGATTLASYGLAYDAANRITQSSGTDGTQDYAYDTTNQLTGASHTTQTNEAYSYDANGNRTNAGYGTGTNNQLLTDGTYNYQYDGEGNRTRRTEIATGKITEYVWDYRNRLTSVLFKDSLGTVTKTIQYTYDVNDRRIGKKIDGAVAERYVYDGSDIALVFDGAGNQTHRYLHGTGVDTVLADERGGAVVWALSDNQGTVRDVVDGNGTILNHITYDSYGRVISQTNPAVEFRYGYTGREQDSETGLDYYRARYYDAANGRFISEDPLGFGAGDTNIYRYVGNSPTNFTDPSGKCPALLIPLIGGLTGLDIIGIGVGGLIGLNAAGNALNDLGNILSSTPNTPPEPYPLLPFPPAHGGIHLGDGGGGPIGGGIGNPGGVPPAYFNPNGGGFVNNDPGLYAPLHTGHGQQDNSGLDNYVFQINPNLPPQNVTGPISVDKSLGLAQDFLDPGIGGRFEVNKQNQSGVQYIQNPYVDDNGRTVVKRVGFDFNPDNKHVQNTGFPHLNLQTQFDGKPAGKNSPYHDPHIPVEPTDIKKNDY